MTPEALRAVMEERETWFKRYIEARDALYQFQYPPDPKMLREIADEIDCGSDCEHGHTEWDTNAHVCSRSDKGECSGEKAWSLRQFADAIEARAEIADPPASVPPSERDEDDAYEIGKRDGFEDAVQTIDMLTGGDGEFFGSTIPGRGQDVPSMLEGIVERFAERDEIIEMCAKVAEDSVHQKCCGHGRIVCDASGEPVGDDCCGNPDVEPMYPHEIASSIRSLKLPSPETEERK